MNICAQASQAHFVTINEENQHFHILIEFVLCCGEYCHRHDSFPSSVAEGTKDDELGCKCVPCRYPNLHEITLAKVVLCEQTIFFAILFCSVPVKSYQLRGV